MKNHSFAENSTNKLKSHKLQSHETKTSDRINRILTHLKTNQLEIGNYTIGNSPNEKLAQNKKSLS